VSDALSGGIVPANRNATVKYVPGWVPGAEFQKKATIWKKYVLEMRDAPFTAVQKALVSAFFFQHCVG
jgi:hypothetical protein